MDDDVRDADYVAFVDDDGHAAGTVDVQSVSAVSQLSATSERVAAFGDDGRTTALPGWVELGVVVRSVRFGDSNCSDGVRGVAVDDDGRTTALPGWVELGVVVRSVRFGDSNCSDGVRGVAVDDDCFHGEEYTGVGVAGQAAVSESF